MAASVTRAPASALDLRICSVKPGSPDSSYSSRGLATKLPPQRPRLRTSSPLDSRPFSAWRSVIRLTPSAPAISTSDGSRSSSLSLPEWMSRSSHSSIRA